MLKYILKKNAPRLFNLHVVQFDKLSFINYDMIQLKSV